MCVLLCDLGTAAWHLGALGSWSVTTRFDCGSWDYTGERIMGPQQGLAHTHCMPGLRVTFADPGLALFKRYGKHDWDTVDPAHLLWAVPASCRRET